MTISAYEKKLETIKEHERPEVVLMISDSPHLTKIVVAWKNLRIQRAKRLSKQVDDTEEGTWNWLWENTRFSKEELLQRIPSSDSKTIQKIDALIANRVLYPDGTANSFVERYLRQKVLKQFAQKSDFAPRG